MEHLRINSVKSKIIGGFGKLKKTGFYTLIKV